VHERRPEKPLGHAGQNVGSKRPLRPRETSFGEATFGPSYLDEHKRLRNRALFVLAIVAAGVLFCCFMTMAEVSENGDPTRV
jgi:hypothetical protein